MVLRATDQRVDVLRSGVPSARVSRQYLEVLAAVSVFEGVCSESITISDVANGNMFTVDISEDITVSDTAAANMFTVRIAESITISDDATTGFVTVHITETINISDTVNTAVVIERTIVESITLTDTFSGSHTLDTVRINESITVQDFVDVELNGGGTVKARSITETINVVDTITRAPIVKSVHIVEHFEPSDYIPKIIFVTDPVTSQLTRITYIDYSSVQDSIAVELVKATATYEVEISENIAVYATAIGNPSPSVTETITVTDSLDVEINVGKTITESIIVSETIAYELVSGISLCTYSPFIGGSSSADAPAAPDSAAPVETSQGNFQFYYPVVGPTDTLTLTGPETHDRDNLQFQRINRISRGLSLKVYADPQWPKIKKLSISANTCTEATAQEVLDFVKLTLGKEIGFRDWRNRNWKGVIDNPQNPITRDGRDTYTVAIEFEAELTEL